MAKANKDILKSYETLQLHAYNDGTGVWTIGWGHTGPEVKPGLVWTPEQADEQLDKDFLSYEQGVEKMLAKPMSQQQFDAVVDMAYNTGLGGAAAVIKKFNAGDMLGAIMEFAEWDEANFGQGLRPSQGLVRRRTRELARFCLGL